MSGMEQAKGAWICMLKANFNNFFPHLNIDDFRHWLWVHTTLQEGHESLM